MSAYVIMLRDAMTDAEAFARYAAAAPKASAGHPLRPLAFYGTPEVLEGPPVDGIVILKFPDMAAARAWYYSPAYTAARADRLAGADYRVLIVEGVA